MELYRERGFDQTTVAEIASRAGLTERTFFRYYADKREVLFGGSDVLEQRIVQTVAAAPDSLAPVDAVALGIEAAAGMLQERREFARQRHAVITANAELQERELKKFASLSAALAQTLRGRGVAEPAASLAGEVGMAIFKTSFERWITGAEGDDFPRLVRDARDELKELAST
jgi:AcrR family transcriptional regulator